MTMEDARWWLSSFLYAKANEYEQSARFLREFPEATLSYAIGNLCAAFADFCFELGKAVFKAG